MKTRILVIEDSLYKSFTTKQVLQAQLRVNVAIVEAECGDDLLTQAAEVRASAVYVRPAGGVIEFAAMLRAKGVNRRNTEIVVVVADDIEDDVIRQVGEHFRQAGKIPGSVGLATAKAA